MYLIKNFLFLLLNFVLLFGCHVYNKIRVVNLWFCMVFLGCSVLGVISSLLLIIGLHKDQREFLAPFIIIMSLDLFLGFLHFIVLMIIGDSKFDPLTGTLFTVDFFMTCLNVSVKNYENMKIFLSLQLTSPQIYCLVCVISQYQEYKEYRCANHFIIVSNTQHVSYSDILCWLI